MAPETSVALYKKIEGEIRQQIEVSTWPVGGILPSRRDLARQFRVSSLTVERAISGLVREGLLRSDDRRGTFVTAISRPTQSDSRQAKLTTIGIVAALYLHHQEHLGLNNHWVRLIVQAVEHGFSGEGETTRFFNRIQPDGTGISLSESIASAASESIDGLVVVAFGHDPREVDEGLAAIQENDLPVVCITSGALRRPTPHIFLGHVDGGYQAAQHLISRSCRKLLYLCPFKASWTQEREEGIRTALDHAGLPSESLRVYPSNAPTWVNELDPAEFGYQAAVKAFRDLDVPLGVICANDGVAFGFLRAAREFNRTPGEDLLVVGFDDHPDSRTLNLTSLRPAMEAMGHEAARLLRLASTSGHNSVQTRLRWNLIPRASSRLTQAPQTIGN